jgi:hypothetical protein
MATMKNTKTNQSKKSVTTTQTKQAPAPAAPSVNSTAEQAPAPQTTQAPNVTPAVTPPTPATPTITGVASGGSTGTRIELQTSYVALITGLQGLYQPSDVLQLSTGDETCADLIADLQQFVQAAENTKASYQAWRGDVQTERQVLADVTPKRAAVRTLMVSRFGQGGTKLLQLGFAPRKPTQKTVEAKAEGVVKTEATRKARGTKGSKQKLEVTGNVSGVVLTPVTSTQTVATPAPEPTPAAPAGAPAATTPAVKPAGS